MTFDRHARRKLFSHGVTVLTGLSVVAVLFPLASIVYTAAVKGGWVLADLRFFTAIPPNGCSQISCDTVGIGPDIQGTLLVVGIAAGISVALGVAAAIFASEYRGRGLGRAISFTADILTGVPSIIAGVFVWTLFVAYDPTYTHSLLSGSLALAVIMVPIIVRTTEEALRTVPSTIREAALALGIPKWKTTLRIVVITALPGVLTGVLLSVMRAAGEAAPLLFTLIGSNFYSQGVQYPAAALPLLIYSFAESPYSNQQSVAWGATLFLIVLILAVNVGARFVIQRMVRRQSGG